MAIELHAYRKVTLDSTGTGIINFDTVFPSKIWQILRIQISCNSQAQTTFEIYLVNNSYQTYISGTTIGNNNSDTTPNLQVPAGQYLMGKWLNGTSGSIARCDIWYTVNDA